MASCDYGFRNVETWKNDFKSRLSILELNLYSLKTKKESTPTELISPIASGLQGIREIQELLPKITEEKIETYEDILSQIAKTVFVNWTMKRCCIGFKTVNCGNLDASGLNPVILNAIGKQNGLYTFIFQNVKYICIKNYP